MQEENSLHGNNFTGQKRSWPCHMLHGKGSRVNSSGVNGAEVQFKKNLPICSDYEIIIDLKTI